MICNTVWCNIMQHVYFGHAFAFRSNKKRNETDKINKNCKIHKKRKLQILESFVFGTYQSPARPAVVDEAGLEPHRGPVATCHHKAEGHVLPLQTFAALCDSVPTRRAAVLVFYAGHATPIVDTLNDVSVFPWMVLDRIVGATM